MENTFEIGSCVYDETSLEMTNNEVLANKSIIDKMVDNVIRDYVGELDDIMEKISKELSEVEEIPSHDLERFCLELTNILYFIGSNLSKLGILEDISESVRKEVYNKSYLNLLNNPGDKKPTVAQLTSQSEEASKYEGLINMIYSRCYKLIKYKVDAASRMVDSVKKIINKRMQDEQFSYNNSQRNTFGRIINEEINNG